MNRAKFSPGPWRVVQDGDFTIVRGPDTNLAYVVAEGHTPTQRQANANVMVAAGDMYFALTALVQEIEENGDDLDQWVMDELLAQAREALDKARGGEDA